MDIVLRDRVYAMDPKDAVDHLLGIVEALRRVAPLTVDTRLVHLSPLERRLVSALLNNPGRIMSKEALLDAMYYDRPDAPAPKIVDVFICKLRKKLPAEFGTIRTLWATGYVLDPAEATCPTPTS